MSLLDRIFTNLGLKAIEADYFGRVILERWFLFGYEDGDKSARPNAFITKYTGQKFPAETAHAHPWSSIAIILRGGYVEIINGSTRRVTKRFSVLRFTDNHRFESVEPGTISLFLHWRAKSTWRFFPVECVKVCATCAEKNNGVCAKPPAEFKWEEKSGLTPHWRVSKWFRADTSTEYKLARRRQALDRLGVSIPTFNDAQEMNDVVIGQFITEKARRKDSSSHSELA